MPKSCSGPLLVLLCAAMAPATLPAQHDMAGMQHDMAGMSLPLGLPHSRMGSGTSWVPDGSVHRDYQTMAGRWMLMGHGIVDLYYDHQGTPRGDDQIGSTNWVMGMAMRSTGNSLLQFSGMLSAEPFTVRHGGYPLLLQSGETYQDEPLHDRQHPHDLFMELSATYSRSLAKHLAVSLYVAPVGEPALGPVAFMHRPSALADPFAPIAHHWQDATHTTYGVATLGLYSHTYKLEASVFNGREPDEHRYDFDFRKLDSWSVRAFANPGTQWSLSASYGFLKSPEDHAPQESQHRMSASVLHTAGVGRNGRLATALIYGANRRKAPGIPAHALQNSVLLESNLQLDPASVVYGRLTWVQKNAEELVVPGLPAEQRFGLATLSLGFARDLIDLRHTAVALGLRGELGRVPTALESVYGTKHPAGLAVYLRLQPRISTNEHQHMEM